MYNNNYKRNGYNRGGGRPRYFAGVRRVKSFDPTSMILNAARQDPSEIKTPIYDISHQFGDFVISDILKSNIARRGYTIPTPIQDQAIAPILEGRDLIGIANTGTGKTAAFLIPLIDKIIKDKNHKVLIITPTRELASQIKDEFITFIGGLNIYCTLCIGGSNMGRQIEGLRRNPNMVIGTPGRIMDLLQKRKLDLSGFKTVVLDEADRMVDIGFIKDIKYMISLFPQNRQSLFFSATIDGKVGEILQTFVKNPVTVSVKTGDTAQNVKQDIVKIINIERKIEQLYLLLNQNEFEKVLVFGRTKHGVQKLSNELVKRGLRADTIHGNKNQSQRLRILTKFKRNEIKILVATDVASRGLDIPNVSHVINYDLPESYDAYIHRVGRTGRADKKGIALTFVN